MLRPWPGRCRRRLSHSAGLDRARSRSIYATAAEVQVSRRGRNTASTEGNRTPSRELEAATKKDKKKKRESMLLSCRLVTPSNHACNLCPGGRNVLRQDMTECTDLLGMLRLFTSDEGRLNVVSGFVSLRTLTVRGSLEFFLEPSRAWQPLHRAPEH